MFKEIVPVCAEKHMKSYKMQNYWLLKQVVHIVTAGF
jgi:hypothetical protein